ncbi:MAG TPA: RDD family protein [Actinomycetota bacterium]
MTNPLPPEARALQGVRAGLVSRFLAGAIDYLVALVVAAGAWLAVAAVRLVTGPTDFAWPDWSGGTFILVYLAALLVSLALPWATIGRSAGKHVFGLRLRTTRGARVGALVALGRALACVVFPIGLFWVAVSAENRSLHDMLFRTEVVYDWSRHLPAAASSRG